MACHFSIKRLRGNDAVADQQYIRVRWNGLAQLGRGADQGNADAVGVQAIDGSGQGWRDRVHMNGNVPGARLCRLPCLIFHQCLPCKDKGSPKRAVTMVQGGTCRNDSRKGQGRSEEHTYELQSLMRISYAVFCLKKKTKTQRSH